MKADSSLHTRAVVLAVFFLSGVSGLVYQVIWVRQFGNAFGNTVHSASLVAGVFMGGLGVGAYVLGKVGDRVFRSDRAAPLRLYALAELAIAALGLGLAWGLPRLDVIGAATSAYVVSDHGWRFLSTGSYAFRYAAAIVLIAPSTFLMGGTLTLLVRTVVSGNVELAGRRIGALYGANTAGAALGALLTDLVFVPALGLFRTQIVAVAINVLAGAAALVLARVTAASTRADANTTTGSSAVIVTDRPAVVATAIALALGGFAAMGLEILWFRILASALGERRAVFSLVLAVVLACIGIGSMVGSRLAVRWKRPALVLLAAECLLAVAAPILLGFSDPRAIAQAAWTSLAPAYDADAAWRLSFVDALASIQPIAAFVALPSLLMGASFPLANASIQRISRDVGGRAGILYLSTCLGNVLGCGLVGFVLLPLVGMQRTGLVLACAAALSAIPLYVSARPFATDADARAAASVLVLFGGLAVVGLSAYAALPADRMVIASLPAADPAWHRRVLDVREGPNETLAVTEIPGFFRELLTNGHSMSSTHPKAQRYMRAFAHIPLLQMDDPKSVLVICFGVGSTTEAAALHDTITRLDVADLSRNVLEHASWFSASNHDVLGDPRVNVFVNDGRHHLLMQAAGTYDLITLEPPPISSAGVAALYSREFYRLARSRLTDRGFITQWLPAYQVPEHAVREAVRAFVDVFPESVLLSGDDNELILMGTRGPSIALDPPAFERRLAHEPRVAADLARNDLGNIIEIAGMFAASHQTMTKAVRGIPPVTDDRPSLEYSVLSPVVDRRMPADLFNVEGVDAWCPGCLARLPRLGPYLRLRGAIYASDFFLLTSMTHPTSFDAASVPGGLETVRESRYLQRLLGGPAVPAKRVALESEHDGRLEDAVSGFLLASSFDPRDADTYQHLGNLLMKLGRADVAALALDNARRLEGDGPRPAPP